jgi:hypothetical protein
MNMGKNPTKCACPRRLIKMFSQYHVAYGKYFFVIRDFVSRLNQKGYIKN